MNKWINRLWDKDARLFYLMVTAVLLIFIGLSAPALWTQEHRWANITYRMLFSHDYFNPYLDNMPYYDKPLLSYWLIIVASWFTGGLSILAIRLPSALSSLLAIWSIYSIGKTMRTPQLGLIAAWLLLSSYYFIFWARVGSADMMNMAGVLFAIYWYLRYRDQPSFTSFSVFFVIMAVTSLCKGLLGFILPVLFIIPDLFHEWRIKRYLQWKLLLAVIPALIVYLIPFILSSHYQKTHYNESGLFEVFRENVIRYFNAYDHKGPIYTYFLYLPIYIFPWIFFFIPAFIYNVKNWRVQSWFSRWIFISFCLIFAFYTGSGSRRSYYTLGMSPFAILLTADYLMASKRARDIAKWVVLSVVVILFLFFSVIKPLAYRGGGDQAFADRLKQKAQTIQPWDQWQIVSLDTQNSMYFYLQTSPYNRVQSIHGSRDGQTAESLLRAFPELCQQNGRQIFITRLRYAPLFRQLLIGYEVVETLPTYGERWLGKIDSSNSVAFIPIPNQAACRA